jgi:hypothetical protein
MAYKNLHIDYPEFGEHVLRAPFMVQDMFERADRIAFRAKQLAPVGSEADGDKHPGAYRDSIFSQVEIKPTGSPDNFGPRAVGVIGSDVPYAGVIEFGDGQQVGRAPLRRALYGSAGGGDS